MDIAPTVKALLNQRIARPHADKMECVTFQEATINMILRHFRSAGFRCSEGEALEIAARIWRDLRTE